LSVIRLVIEASSLGTGDPEDRLSDKLFKELIEVFRRGLGHGGNEEKPAGFHGGFNDQPQPIIVRQASPMARQDFPRAGGVVAQKFVAVLLGCIGPES
jgi:hypothetical protein